MLKFAEISKKHRKAEQSRKLSTMMIRLTKDMTDLNLPKTCELMFSDPDDIGHFTLNIKPNEGFYEGIKVLFEITATQNYPYEPPKVKCLTKVFHPNIDMDGNVCLNILREDWTPALSISSILHGLQFLLLEPNANDPLNKKAADLLINNPQRFCEIVKKTAKGLMPVEEREDL